MVNTFLFNLRKKLLEKEKEKAKVQAAVARIKARQEDELEMLKADIKKARTEGLTPAQMKRVKERKDKIKASALQLGRLGLKTGKTVVKFLQEKPKPVRRKVVKRKKAMKPKRKKPMKRKVKRKR